MRHTPPNLTARTSRFPPSSVVSFQACWLCIEFQVSEFSLSRFNNRSLKEIGKILIFLLATVMLGALIAPALFWAGQMALHYSGAHGLVSWQNQDGEWIAKGPLSFLASDFQRYFNRAILIAAFALLPPLVRSLRIASREQLGLRP